MVMSEETKDLIVRFFIAIGFMFMGFGVMYIGMWLMFALG